MIDSSSNHAGKLIITKVGRITLNKYNKQMPFWVEDGYKFYDLTFVHRIKEKTDDTFLYQSQPLVANDKTLSKNLLAADGASKYEIMFSGKFNYMTDADIMKYLLFDYADANIINVYSSLNTSTNRVLTMDVYGISGLHNRSVTTVIRSITTGVEMEGALVLIADD